MEISIEGLSQRELSAGRLGISVVHTVRETLARPGDKDKQILYLYFWKELPQEVKNMTKRRSNGEVNIPST